ncbi:MAG: hypothetical protein K9L30_07510 [Desulfobacterales bacterium]|nr:hypothetical protein [Desulfobacterales bacterium]
MKRFVVALPTKFANLCGHIIAPSQSIKKLFEKCGTEKHVDGITTGFDLELF